MSTWTPTSELARIVDLAGFDYDPEQDIIYSKMNALQRKFGYCYAYDFAAPGMSADIDCEPIYFEYGGKIWMIELWKGQYGVETGCEIGVYNRPKANPDWHFGLLDPIVGPRPDHQQYGLFYDCASDADMLTMSLTLRRDGEVLFTRGPERHWWLTGFKWGVYSSPRQLVVDATIEFPNADMLAAFGAALAQLGYQWTADGTKASFRFDTPKTYQPNLNNPAIPGVDAANQAIVELYRSAGLPNNDPNQIPGWVAQKILGTWLARSADAFGDLVSGALRGVGKSIEDAFNVLVKGLGNVVDDVTQWITQAGYGFLEWLQVVGKWIEKVFTDYSSIVEIDNLFHGSEPPPTLRLVPEATRVRDHFAVKPPKLIRPGVTARFTVIDPKGFGSAGSEATVVYSYLDSSGQTQQVTLHFGCPSAPWDPNFANASGGKYTTYAWSGEWSGPAWSRDVPKLGHPLYVAYVWNGGPPPSN